MIMLCSGIVIGVSIVLTYCFAMREYELRREEKKFAQDLLRQQKKCACGGHCQRKGKLNG